ncbi:MAG: hypothetical protein WD995_10295 [Gemmatimonadota bacterium]
MRPFLRRVVPDRLRTYRGDRWRDRVDAATARAWRVTRGRVQHGPFATMRYTRTGFSQLGPKLLGTYEQELHPVIVRLISEGPKRVVNVGAAEGYYAVGLLMRTSGLRITGFERSAEGRALMREFARLNGVIDRLDIRGTCTPDTLDQSLGTEERPRVLMDVEGEEHELLDPRSVPGLGRAEILVEMHEFAQPGVTAEIMERFGPTHVVSRIAARERTAATVPTVPGMSHSDVVLAAFERSAEDQEWLWLVPRDA